MCAITPWQQTQDQLENQEEDESWMALKTADSILMNTMVLNTGIS